MLKNELRRTLLRVFIIATLIIVIIFILPIILFWNWSFNVSDYCQKQAQAIVGDRWVELLPPTEEERKQFPDIDEISYGFREQLKCEQDPQTLEKFKGWF